jgi:hypothetical protein
MKTDKKENTQNQQINSFRALRAPYFLAEISKKLECSIYRQYKFDSNMFSFDS